MRDRYRFATTIRKEVSALRENEESLTARLVLPQVLNGLFELNHRHPALGWREQLQV